MCCCLLVVVSQLSCLFGLFYEFVLRRFSWDCCRESIHCFTVCRKSSGMLTYAFTAPLRASGRSVSSCSYRACRFVCCSVSVCLFVLFCLVLIYLFDFVCCYVIVCSMLFVLLAYAFTAAQRPSVVVPCRAVVSIS